MFGIGIQELAIIFIVALLIFGPKRLPEFARSLGKGLAEFRRASSDLRQSFSLDADSPTPPPPSAEEDPRTSEAEPERPPQAVDAPAPESAKDPAANEETTEAERAKTPGSHDGA
ncbi:MAG: twin-arginine translocase TatA/TatE family subunit [Myxococcota bacterium]|nr:twin-arginine translocase TatA/TatE family subunit [Myxococcota bacterium]